MKLALLLLSAVASSSTALMTVPSPELVAFAEFKTKFNISFTVEEETQRFEIFKANLRAVGKMNEGESEAIFGITKFSALSPAEFKKQFLTYRPAQADAHDDVEVTSPPVNFTAPTSADWRTKGAVTPVKDQGQCGSCWAYSATEQIESNWFLAGNKLTEFSPQQIISCDKVDLGCNGGNTETAYAYVEKAGGLALETKYKDTSAKSGLDGKCKKKKAKAAGGAVKAFTYATKHCATGACKKQNLNMLAANVASKAPASICVNAGAWQSYTGGVMTVKKCGGFGADDLDHCVQLVGFNQAKGYWIVRNSWNTDWGIDGYIHLEMKKGANTCGLANDATFVSF